MSTRLRRASTRPLRLFCSLVLTVATTVFVSGAAAAGSGPGPASAGPTTPSPAGTAVRYALRQLGDPYHYGAAGPGAFDCSGLTMRAYAAAGIALPHSSREQYRRSPRIGRAHWRAGDLVFWASNPHRPATIYHVAIWLGGGRVLDAPRTGERVGIRKVFGRGQLMHVATRPGGLGSRPLNPAGRSGDAVRDHQMRLRANGFGIRVSGLFDAPTSRAIRQFQGRLGLRRTGEPTTATWRGLVRHGARTHTT